MRVHRGRDQGIGQRVEVEPGVVARVIGGHHGVRRGQRRNDAAEIARDRAACPQRYAELGSKIAELGRRRALLAVQRDAIRDWLDRD
ncbi:hypothetical protein [Nocardia sp. NPDC050793]|uniref:hypothetical protein n=1 Tax=Nocardia sp. NPDC050793 TaxID=3155159 RepID=UPI0033C9EA20